ncbi:MAG: multidrug ABC transporter ATP-binding protein [Tenericutes bacterium GWC2_34_14]|nr:MAG: multidrug ABC transporter ATP-binding protein [Tenericutes bacterium GWA2_35_7]OHE28366.1 MAG: multidrug ABC transporter ATP-binding protein [Tenericutes bacterium GWC2_34_14]OHE33726.1 MAG: multidrug ABC transporter ATP-binding protein [Tenericutes bacterium GWE2_34_108]OHE37011.1 MAG: multidrug ABC transporter ATP-binding protein [Tenericutes bacterium GWF1_35_14]OHE37909.1 MAG: multidrug ABC transporter ATP-binding protein [Tenericutes bacterium GWF2_35_184]OHE41086.1 MAG: multidrug
MSNQSKDSQKPVVRPMHGPMGRMGGGEKPKSMKNALKQLLTYIKPYRLQFLMMIMFAMLGAALAIAGPKLLGNITSEIQKGIAYNPISGTFLVDINFDVIYNIVYLLILLYGLSLFFNVTQGILVSRMTQKISKQLRTDLFKKMERLPLKYFDQHPHGDTLSRMTNDIDTIGQAMNSSVSSLFSSITLLIGVLIMMLTISGWLTLVAMITLPSTTVLMGLIMKKARGYFRKQQQTLGLLNGHIEENYTNQQIVKTYQAEQTMLDTFEVHNKDLYESSWKSQFISGLMMPLTTFVSNLSYVAISVVGGILAISRGLLIGDIQSMLMYVRTFSQPLGNIAQSLTMTQTALAASERVFEFLNEPEMIVETRSVEMNKIKGNVRFDHVRFGYVEGKEIIHDFNAEIKAGQKIAIVGPTGAGKTTLVNLLMRFYELNSGSIQVDGIKTTDLTRDQVHELFGMVLQDTWLFKGSIKDNLKYGKPDVSDELMIQATQAANIDHFIKSLPYGYDMVLDENASISQGQKQLLTIARAMIVDAPMLILDEATSSVDVRTELLIQEAMDRLMKGRTTFVIAHRLSTIKNADLIFVLKDGNIVETGTHNTLLEQQGFYADLYNSQFETE